MIEFICDCDMKVTLTTIITCSIIIICTIIFIGLFLYKNEKTAKVWYELDI